MRRKELHKMSEEENGWSIHCEQLLWDNDEVTAWLTESLLPTSTEPKTMLMTLSPDESSRRRDQWKTPCHCVAPSCKDNDFDSGEMKVKFRSTAENSRRLCPSPNYAQTVIRTHSCDFVGHPCMTSCGVLCRSVLASFAPESFATIIYSVDIFKKFFVMRGTGQAEGGGQLKYFSSVPISYWHCKLNREGLLYFFWHHIPDSASECVGIE